MYRINYNQGQVSATFDTYDLAKRAICDEADYSVRIGQPIGSMYLQRYEGDGEWSAANLTAEQSRPHRHRK